MRPSRPPVVIHPFIQGSLTLGAVMAATFLARLDTVFFLSALGIFVLINLRGDLRLSAAWIAPTIVLPIPYLLLSLLNFGRMVPVSGLRKTIGFSLSLQGDILGRFWVDKLGKLIGVLHPVGTAVVLFAIALGLFLTRHELKGDLKRMGILWVVPVGALLHFAYVVFVMNEADIYWFQYSEYLTAFLFFAMLTAGAAAWLRAHLKSAIVEWIPFALVPAGVVAILLFYAPRKLPNQTSLQVYRTAVWARNNMRSAPEARFGMVDSGIFRFVSGFKPLR